MDLSDLIWGVNDTRHLLGTTVSATPSCCSPIRLCCAFPSRPSIGVEKQFKAVTCGQAIDDVTEIDFTTWGFRTGGPVHRRSSLLPSPNRPRIRTTAMPT